MFLKTLHKIGSSSSGRRSSNSNSGGRSRSRKRCRKGRIGRERKYKKNYMGNKKLREEYAKRKRRNRKTTTIRR